MWHNRPIILQSLVLRSIAVLGWILRWHRNWSIVLVLKYCTSTKVHVRTIQRGVSVAKSKFTSILYFKLLWPYMYLNQQTKKNLRLDVKYNEEYWVKDSLFCHAVAFFFCGISATSSASILHATTSLPIAGPWISHMYMYMYMYLNENN